MALAAGAACVAAPTWLHGQAAKESVSAPRIDPGWAQAVAGLADLLTRDGTSAPAPTTRPAEPSLANAWAGTFGWRDGHAASQLVGRFNRATVLGFHAYAGAPETLATDIAGDLGRSSDVSDSISRLMVPQGEGTAAEANRVAREWLAQQLQPEAADATASIILLQPPPAGPGDTQPVVAGGESLLLVLVKGTKVNGTWQITRVCYGTPDQAMQ